MIQSKPLTGQYTRCGAPARRLAYGNAPSSSASISHSQNEERIDINTASVEELQRFPGVSPAIASRIVERRRKRGLFKRPQDIVIVRGMSAKLYRRIAHLIRV
jgi:competence protein ComEA